MRHQTSTRACAQSWLSSVDTSRTCTLPKCTQHTWRTLRVARARPRRACSSIVSDDPGAADDDELASWEGQIQYAVVAAGIIVIIGDAQRSNIVIRCSGTGRCIISSMKRYTII
mmetsp:Transcript_1467/g.3636  ORF Transcript_1467/g.3636 Transcript_1467/m.3636 type:complete len:114 (+) Transcript_1467:995-1336(+)